MDDKQRLISVSAEDLAGIVHTGRRGEPFRILVRLEPEEDGTPAVGYYVEAERHGQWRCVTDGIAATADDAATNLSRLAELAHGLDPYLSAWETFHGAVPDPLADWIQETCRARAVELGLTAYAIAKATGGQVSEDHVQAYLTRRKSMGSHKLQHIFAALGLVVVKEDGQ